MPTSDDATDWEVLARQKISSQAEARAQHLKTATGELAFAFRTGEVTHEEVRRFRQGVEMLLDAVEDDIIQHSPGFEAFGNPENYILTHGMAADYFDTEVERIDEARDGVLLELSPAVIRQLADGHGVEVRSPAGIPVEIVPAQPESAVDVFRGP